MMQPQAEQARPQAQAQGQPQTGGNPEQALKEAFTIIGMFITALKEKGDPKAEQLDGLFRQILAILTGGSKSPQKANPAPARSAQEQGEPPVNRMVGMNEGGNKKAVPVM